jgi:hypothetical protein
MRRGWVVRSVLFAAAVALSVSLAQDRRGGIGIAYAMREEEYEARSHTVPTPTTHGRSLKQILAPVRYSMVSYRDALYELGEALVDLALVRRQFEWVPLVNDKRAELMEHHHDASTTNDYTDDVTEYSMDAETQA